MTDPRMTPTNDAPVTVEQAIDAEVARIMAMSDDEIMREADADDAAWARGFKLGLASGKSAALASAPAVQLGPQHVRDMQPALMAHADRIVAMYHWSTDHDRDCAHEVARIGLQHHPDYQPASAPAGDGDAIAKALDALKWANERLHKCGKQVDFTLGMVTTLSESEKRHAAAVEALARPRAAVGEQSREAIKLAIASGMGEYIMPGAPYDRAVNSILALQSPPAKVEG